MPSTEKTPLNDEEQIIFKLERGKWTAHVSYASSGISGLASFPSFDAAAAALKEAYRIT